jgi:DNA-binding IclR family transcriptional regulator
MTMSAHVSERMPAAARPGADSVDFDADEVCRDSVVGRISLVIDAFDGLSPSLSLSELTKRTGLPKSTVHRMADQLVGLRWLERSPNGYRLGLRFFEVGGLVGARGHLRERALPFLQDLQSAARAAVHLGLLDGGDVVILEKLWGHGAPSLPTRIGGRMPAHCTAAGKALLAFAPDPVIESVIEAGLPARTPRTIVNPDAFRRELATVRRNHWAVESEENVPGLRCVAAPIRGAGRSIAAVSVSGPLHRIDIKRVVPLVRRCATDVWGHLFARRDGEGLAGPGTGISARDDEWLQPWLELSPDDWF